MKPLTASGQLRRRTPAASSAPTLSVEALALVTFGTGLVLVTSVTPMATVASVPPDRAAMGSGANNTARYLGAAIGITLFSVLMTHTGDGLPQGWNDATLVAAALTCAVAAATYVVSRKQPTP
jgi:predicted MFS family arabinose efflux permease